MASTNSSSPGRTSLSRTRWKTARSSTQSREKSKSFLGNSHRSKTGPGRNSAMRFPIFPSGSNLGSRSTARRQGNFLFIWSRRIHAGARIQFSTTARGCARPMSRRSPSMPPTQEGSVSRPATRSSCGTTAGASWCRPMSPSAACRGCWCCTRARGWTWTTRGWTGPAIRTCSPWTSPAPRGPSHTTRCFATSRSPTSSTAPVGTSWRQPVPTYSGVTFDCRGDPTHG